MDAKKDYSHVISGYRNELRLNGKATLSAYCRSVGEDHGVGSTDHFSALKIWMFENKFVSLLSHLKTIEPMEVHRGQELCVIQKLQK